MVESIRYTFKYESPFKEEMMMNKDQLKNISPPKI